MAEIFNLAEIREIRRMNSLDAIEELTKKRLSLFRQLCEIAMQEEERPRFPGQYKEHLESNRKHSELMNEIVELGLEMHEHHKRLTKLD